MEFYTNVVTWGDNVLLRGVDARGTRFNKKIENFRPYVWIPTSETNRDPEDYRTISGDPVRKLCPSSIKETRKFIEQNSEIDNFAVYGDIQPQYQYIQRNYSSEIQWDATKINVVYFDIETARAPSGNWATIEDADGEILSISVKSSIDGVMYYFGRKESQRKFEGTNYIYCDTEEKLILKFLEYWSKDYPDIITGYNCNTYDTPYLINRTFLLLGEKVARKFSPWGVLREREVFFHGKAQKTYSMMGIAILDYMELYKKFTYKVHESYTLDYIAFVELGKKKVSYAHIGGLDDLYEKDYDLFVEYNIFDTQLVVELEEKLGLIQQAITIAYDSKINYEDVYSEIRMWDVIIYDYLLKKNIVIPPRKDNIPVKIPGGFVKEPVPNMYFWVASMDLTSLYPHLIMQYNISPDTIVSSKKLKLDLDKLVSKTEVFEIEPDECIAGNGQVFRKDRAGFLSELMAWMFKQRKVYKNKMLEAEKELELLKESGASKEEIFEKQKTISKFNNLQMAKKIGLNSAYGACASQYFRYFNPSIASAITLSGQLSIRWIERKMNEFLNRIMETSGVDYIITCDTDSIYMNMAPVVEKFYKGNPTVEDTANFVSKISQEKISDYILKSYKELASYMMCNENKMFMKLEAICDRTIFQAKKQYVLRVVENEGVHYAKPKIKLKGIQAVKSSTPYSCREKLKEALGVILSGTNSDVWEFIEAFRKEFYSMRPHEVAFPRSVKGLSKYRDPVKLYGKGTPIHVRGSLVYNNYLKKFGLEKKYSQIYEGDKIRFVYLSLPNKLGENIIAFPSSMELPEELGLHDFIDYKKQFEKSFMSPLKLTLDAIRWSQKEITTLEQFFV